MLSNYFLLRILKDKKNNLTEMWQFGSASFPATEAKADNKMFSILFVPLDLYNCQLHSLFLLRKRERGIPF
jgi:hypothetical protein